MAVLLTGGTGKTGIPLARLLQEANVPFLLASRRGEAGAPPGMPAIKFDWEDASTFEKPFQHKFPNGERISAVYLVTSIVPEAETIVTGFVDYAVKEHGVRRFVLLANSLAAPGGPRFGKLWQHFIDTGIEYAVLGPTWFMDNLLQPAHRFSIKNESKIYTASQDGKFALISTVDIVAVAFRTLTDEKPHNTGYKLIGPQQLTYDEIAAKFSTALGRQIVHVKLTGEEKAQQLIKGGVQPHYAKMLAGFEVESATGTPEVITDDVERVLGRPATTFSTFAELNKESWQ